MVAFPDVTAALREKGPLEYITEQEEDFAQAIEEAYKASKGKRKTEDRNKEVG